MKYSAGLVGCLALFACSDGTAPDRTELVADSTFTTFGQTITLPWSDLTGHIAIHFYKENPGAFPSHTTVFVDAEKQEFRYLGDFGNYIGQLALSPDGSIVAIGFPYFRQAYVGLQSTQRAIHINGSFVMWYSGAYCPSWRPSGALNYWYADTMYTHNAGGEPVAVPDVPLGTGERAGVLTGKKMCNSWGPGENDFFIVRDPNPSWSQRNWGVYRVSTTDFVPKLVIPPDTSAPWINVDVSPDGRRLVIAKANELWIANTDGSDLQKVSSGMSAAVWSPDSRFILASGLDEMTGFATPGLYLIRVSDGFERKLTDLVALHASWSR